MSAVASQPELSCAPNGTFSFALPAAANISDDLLGESVRVNVDGLVFDVTIDRHIQIPPVCRSIQDAKYFAMAISFQILVHANETLTALAGAVPLPAGDAPVEHDGPVAEEAADSMAADHGAIESPSVSAFGSVAGSMLPDRDAGLSFVELFEHWREHHLLSGGAPTTPPHWETLIQRFAGFLGHQDPTKVSTQDVRNYRDHLIRSGRLIRTARHSDLAALRSVFRFGIEQGLLDMADPTSGVRFRNNRLGTSRRMMAFSDDEARVLLQAADLEEKPARRWIPWLTALTGSRISTIVNLRREDVVKRDDIWCIRISRQAGPVKTAASERIVPLHPLILERGFIDFALSAGRDRLFINRTRDDFILDGKVTSPTVAGPYNPGRTTRNRLTEWIHSLGLDIGRSAGKDPSHAWRHWFKEKAFEVGIPEKITDAIVGHAQASVSRRYGAVSIPIMFDELKKIPDPLKS
ncbi:tyrosine-type recombinase/integrase [Phreatobacter sp. AB_2022a]|uniref:tyrosine-type recombinase/integrase n=1 Tax=Phreatobacter sp. AB_2022a TaxID=3003134 RepID=UPI002287504E|nr:tyrosine-type recombinase/integrase [Phreatobacter sp. AB_2022a]MCZ0736526.1 tyrosine-type recombinase/integrase [Phreatobacter sp. AB_2022a]